MLITNTKRLFYPLTIFLINILLKFYKIENGNYVIWDESHFGKFARKYLVRQFYFDVHPPLGKLMTALSGYLCNQDKEFKFESGMEYPDSFDYVNMRRFHAIVSAFVPLFTYGTMRNLGYTRKWSFLNSAFFVFENGNVAISRLILLDSHLLLFTAMVLFFFSKWRFKKSPFNIFLLGVSIGLTMSVKWIGCFTIFFVGLYVIQELYSTLKYKGIKKFATSFVERAFFLILIPILIYLFWFVIHFKILIHSSSEEAHMSSLFHLNLVEHKTKKIGKYIDFGKIITIKSNLSGNLHSHSAFYPNKTDQQITIYHHKDANDDWIIQKISEAEDHPDFLKDKDKILLLHSETRKYLGIYGKSLTAEEKRAGGLQDLTQQNIFQIEIHNDILKKEDYVKTVTSKFRIYSIYEKCYLQPSGRNYPEWGYGQGEVICSEKKDENSLWNIESNENFSEKNINYDEIKKIKFQFFKNFFDLNKTMFRVNSSFVQDKDLEQARIVSKPHEWFTLRRGLRMVNWDSKRPKFYMFGNPFIWYLSSISILMTPILYLFSPTRKKKEGFEFYLCFFGWICHYAPFFILGRVLYFHHYFPAMLFATLSISFVVRRIKRLLPLLIFMSVFCFVIYSPLTYGFTNAGFLKYISFIRSWDFL